MSAVERVWAWEALDSRGTPTVACEVILHSGARAEATVPSGASTGTFEAHELRDGGERYGGKGVRTAVAHVNGELAAAVTGIEAGDQEAVDAALRTADGTPNLGRLGANAVLSVSVATARASAAESGQPLYRTLGPDPLIPMPMVNIISGGAHAEQAVDVQDFLVVPVGASCFTEAIEWAWRVRRATKDICAERGLVSALIADEGGLGPVLTSNREALDLLAAGIERSGLEPGSQAAIAIDVAATQFHRAGRYVLSSEDRELEPEELVEMLIQWCDVHPIVSIEDALADDDWEGWAAATQRLGGRVQLLGDDLFVTDLDRLERGISGKVANSVLVKPNQTGTVSSAAAVVRRCEEAGYAAVVSARSGETEDSWVADMAVGWRAGQIKIGSTMRSERTAKWNRLLRIEAELGSAAEFAGRRVIGGADVSL